MNRIAVRRAWWRVHQWVGVTLVLLLIPLGLSGIVLAWDGAIDRALSPARYRTTAGPALGASRLAASAQAAAPAARLAFLRLPEKGGEPAVAGLVLPGGRRGDARRPGSRLSVWLDPATGRVLDRARGDAGLVAVAHRFHGSLFVPGPGRALVGLLGVALFLLAATGLWLWWPQAGPWARALRWRRGDKRLDTNLHHMAGFWIALPLGIQAFTGAAIAWPQMAAAGGLAPGRPPGGPGRTAPLPHPRLQPDQAIAAARGGAPGVPRLVGWPSAPDARWRVTLADGPRTADMEVDDGTGAARPAKARGAGFPRAARRLHQGDTLGVAWRLALIPIGLSPTVLGLTGVLMWWRGRGRRRRAAVRTRMAVPQPA